MKVLVMNCSPVRNGATAEIVNIVTDCLEKKHDVKNICIDDYDIKFCKGCRKCHTTAKCVQKDDVDRIIEQYEWADIVISVSPSYWADIPGQFKAFIDRCTPWCNTHEPHAKISSGKKGYVIALRTGPGMSVLWAYRTDEALASIEQQCYSISYCLLGSEKKALKEKGLEFVQEVYDVLWSFIYNCIAEKRPLLNQYKSEFPLFTEICSELIRSIDEMNVEEVEKRLKLLERNIDDMRAFRYVSEKNEDKTKGMLGKLFRMIFIGNKSEEQIDKEVDLMYDDLEKMVKKKQKERYIRLAKEAQENYESRINEEEICEKIKDDTIKNIKEKFAPILIESDEKNGIVDVNLLNLIDYTSSMGTKNSTNGYYSHMDGMFLFGIARFLYQRGVVEFKKRFDDFADDKEFMEYLAANNFHLLLGSQYILKNRDYRISAEYKRFLEDYETIYTTVLQDGIALRRNSIQVCLHDINVSIHSPSIKEENVEYDRETGKYYYPILNGLPIDFDEDELREFLYNNRKVINVTAKISIQVNEKPCGTVFTGRKRG